MSLLAPESPGADRLGQPVLISPYDPGWPGSFEQEKAVLETAIGSWAAGGIHHVGSTAVPGVDAEPVVDILVGTGAASAPPECVEALARLGYERAVEGGEAQTFRRAGEEGRRYDLYLAGAETAAYAQMLVFRDLLRADCQRAIAYAGLKRDLARRYAADRRGYDVAKGELVEAVLARLSGSPLIAL